MNISLAECSDYIYIFACRSAFLIYPNEFKRAHNHETNLLFKVRKSPQHLLADEHEGKVSSELMNFWVGLRQKERLISCEKNFFEE